MVGAVIVGILGVIFTAVGYLIWTKEKITLLHEYHYDKVRPIDQKAFCRLSGWGVISIGVGLLITAVIIGMTDSAWSFLAFAAGMASGIELLIHAGKKYNRRNRETD